MILGALILVTGLFLANSIGVFLRLLMPSVLGVVLPFGASSWPPGWWTVLPTSETATSRS